MLGIDPPITKTAQVLLEHGASFHVRNKNGHMPLHAASYLGFGGIVALLLKFGADVDAQDDDAMTPLHLVSQARPSIFNHSQIVKTAQLLLEHGASVHARDKHSHMPLHYASYQGLSDIIGLLLKFGADVDATDNNTMTPLHLVSQSPLHAVGNDSQITSIAQLLLKHGASVHVRNKYGKMPLHTALHHGLSGLVALLLKFGADVEAQDNDTMTPLHLISHSSPPVFGDDSQITKIAQLLLKKGASVHARNKHGHVPLHLASHHGLSGVVEVLLKFGADVNARDKINSTPMHFAISSPFTRGFSESHPGSPQMIWSVIRTVKLLLAHGANLQIQNVIGETPFHVALRRRELFIFNLLTEHVQNDQAM
jgi:cytohesin